MKCVVTEAIQVDGRYETQPLKPDDHRLRLDEAPFQRAGTGR
jgi:hypothetical protein